MVTTETTVKIVRTKWVAGLCAIAAAVSACSSGGSGSSGTTAGRPAKTAKTIAIVVGENFWGSIVAQLAGTAGAVTTVVTNPNADPHNYESSSDDARAFATADYVVLNGAGYDAWATKLLNANPNSKRKVTTVADVLAKHEGDNPHFWYDPAYVTRVADRVTSDLKAIDTADSGYLDRRRAAFEQALAPYHARLSAIRTKFAGSAVASTESIFVYLAGYLGLNVVSPTDFMNAVAEGNDPPAPSVVAFQSVLQSKQAKVLVYNQQTSTAVTTNLKKLATNQGIPVVGVTETIQPPDATFQDWFTGQLNDLQNALDASALASG